MILPCCLHDIQQIILRKISKTYIDSNILAFVIHFLIVIFQWTFDLWGILLIDNLQILYIFLIWPGYFDLFKRIQTLVELSLHWFNPPDLRTILFYSKFSQFYKGRKCRLKFAYYYTWYSTDHIKKNIKNLYR